MLRCEMYEGKRVFVYARVTEPLAKYDEFSIIEQIAMCGSWIELNRAQNVGVFSEIGSANDGRRCEYRKMNMLAQSHDNPADIILVNSLSCLIGNTLDFSAYAEWMYTRKVEIVSIEHQMGEDPSADFGFWLVELFNRPAAAVKSMKRNRKRLR